MAYSGADGVITGSPPCGACKFLRRKCAAERVFAAVLSCRRHHVAAFLQVQVAQAKTQVLAGAVAGGNPVLQHAWQVEREPMTSTQSSYGCYR